MTSTSIDRQDVMWFIAWSLTGAGYAVGILGALSIGPFVLVVSVAATILLATRTGSRVGLPGLISGLSVPLFYVAFVNRSGPGSVCISTATSRSCVDRWSPWPWLMVGIVLLASGWVWFTLANRRRGIADPLSDGSEPGHQVPAKAELPIPPVAKPSDPGPTRS